MLLRSSSTPILKSWVPVSKESPDSDAVPRIPRTRSGAQLSTVLLSVTTSPAASFMNSGNEATGISSKITRTPSENEFRECALLVSKSKQSPQCSHGFLSMSLEEEEKPISEEIGERAFSMKRLFSTSGLDELVEEIGNCDLSGLRLGSKQGRTNFLQPLPNREDSNVLKKVESFNGDESEGAYCSVEVEEEEVNSNYPSPMFVGGGFGIGNSGGFCGGGGNGDGDGESGSDSNSMDAYYQNMIKANPGNALLLGNYARFLKKVRCDCVKAEEYFSKAILADPGDGDVLSLYADLIWENKKDAPRAESYFDQAIKATPDDCYVLASYAHFLWDSEVDDKDETHQEQREQTPPPFFHDKFPPLAAAS